ncbi:hypothetical protein [Murimonas intestini]|uniref:Glucan-binding repeat-containing protein n=1 Tax=Murimonas intestini TaxID=1337051 RepID=A0AB73TBA2_9FIRM|nr:hypothetical protein [Murimonas intestini]MCR1838751.1 hypothetical protein [Murimonas intestini]MCR1864051.1 hypothetical protein [Murimonas intestini]MCR1881661.1 hypothetical protein [Murimonas intestini]
MKRGSIIKKLMISAGCLAFSFMLYHPLNADAAWSKTASSQWVYYDDSGNLLTSRWIGGKYYVGEDGIMYTNRWAPSSIGDCFVGEDGKWIPDFKGGWHRIGGKWYYYSPEGEKLTGWQQVKGKWYYMNPSGAMLSGGWKKIDDVWYYFDASGSAACNGWKQIGGKWYFFDEACKMQTGFVTSKGKQYYCNENGAMLTGWKKIDGIYYYMNSSGAIQTNKWVRSGSRWYYVQSDGKMGTGWITDSGKTYYCNSSGAMLTGWQMIDGSYYYFNGSGAMLKNQWFRSGSKWYYLQADGRMATGFIDVDGKTYYCNGSGAMLTGWQMIDGIYYYFNGSGAMVTHEWKKSGSSWYFLQDNGMMATGLIEVDGEFYYCSDNGVMLTGLREIAGIMYYFEDTISPRGHARKNDWKSYNGYWYYFGGSGQAVTGLQNINGKTYYFNDAGIMVTNTTISANGVTYSVDSAGVCTVKNDPGPQSDLLFFTLFESGRNYNQTGGDSGNACGYYQFDYRYSLQQLLQYCYGRDPVAFAEFAPFLSIPKEKLKGNTDLYKAWNSIYAKTPELFARCQDDFAYEQYYEPTEWSLRSLGINISSRPNVVKGSVFSYAIQHGGGTAALAISKAGITNQMTDEEFINKIYEKRIKDYPPYTSRYIAERNLALQILRGL